MDLHGSRYTDAMRRVIKDASKGKASRFDVCDRDILMAILKLKKGLAARQAAPDEEIVEQALAEMTSGVHVNGEQLVQQAVVESKRRGDWHIGTEHLLLAMLRSPESSAGSALIKAGMNLDGFEKWMTEASSRRQVTIGRWARKLGLKCRGIYLLLAGRRA